MLSIKKKVKKIVNCNLYNLVKPQLVEVLMSLFFLIAMLSAIYFLSAILTEHIEEEHVKKQNPKVVAYCDNGTVSIFVNGYKKLIDGVYCVS